MTVFLKVNVNMVLTRYIGGRHMVVIENLLKKLTEGEANHNYFYRLVKRSNCCFDG